MTDTKEQIQRPPAEGAITIAEIDLEMVALHNNNDNNITRYAAIGGVCYPHVMLPLNIARDARLLSNVRQQDKSRSGTEDKQQLATNGNDIIKKAQIRPIPMANNERGDNAQAATAAVMRHRIGVEKVYSSSNWQETISWMLQADSREIIQAFMKKIGIGGLRPWQREWIDWAISLVAPPPSRVELTRAEWPVISIAWHPYKQIMGIIHRDDMLLVYNVEEQEWFPDPLYHPLQQDTVQMAWRPNAAGALAVVCRLGIALWRFPLHHWRSTTGSPQAYMTWLQHTAIYDVSCCAWDPTGQFLAVAGRSDASLLIWHIATETVVPIRRIGSGITSLQWSPDGQYLCTGPRANDALRIWETKTWTAVRAAELSSGVTSLCWAPSSRHILFSLENDTHIYVLQLISSRNQLEFRILDEPRNLKSVALRDEEGKMIRVGGVIRNMALDPNGERLAVTFKSNKKKTENAKNDKNNTPTDTDTQSSGSELIMVFMVRLSSWIGERRPLLQSGYIRGPPVPEYEPGDILNVAKPPHASALAFARQFDRGSLLAVAWDNGKVTFVPFFYLANKRLGQNTDQYPENQYTRQRGKAW